MSSSPRLVHLGSGAFARAHTWWATAAARDGDTWPIVATTRRSRAAVAELESGYHVVLADGATVRVDAVGGISTTVVDTEAPSATVEAIADPRTAVVTVTATEAAYTMPADPSALASSVVGRLAAAIDRRHRADAGPLTVVCCDNVLLAGTRMRALVAEALERSGLAEVAADLGTTVEFPDAVVDRIVPRLTSTQRAEWERSTGIEDPLLTLAEPTFRWVIDDRFAGARPAWERAGARFVADVEPWHAAKLTLVNLPHLVLAFAGLAAGHDSTREAVGDPRIRRPLQLLLDRALVASVPEALGLDAAADAAASLRRFANPAIRHPLAQIAEGARAKLQERLAVPWRYALATGGSVRGVAAVLALGVVCAPDVGGSAGGGTDVVSRAVGAILPEGTDADRGRVALDVARALGRIEAAGVAGFLAEWEDWLT